MCSSHDRQVTRARAARQSSAASSVSSCDAARVAFSALEPRLEALVRHAEHDVAVHLRRSGGSCRRRSARRRGARGPRTVASLRPRLRTVSIMPGHRGARARAHRHEQRVARRRRSARPSLFSTFASARAHLALQRASGTRPPRALRRRAQTSVEIVKPGGTGTPSRVISARFAPLPPSSVALRRALPSARPPPKK